MKKTFYFLVMLFFLEAIRIANAQETDTSKILSFETGMDVYSRYIWRGQNLGGNSLSLQPFLNFNVKNLKFGIFSAVPISRINVQEFDVSVSYNLFDLFEIGVFDYWINPEFSIDTISGTEIFNGYKNYFEYRKDLTSHVFEGSIKYLGSENSPIQFLAAVNFWGADSKKANGELQYSTYLELTYMGKLDKQNFDFFIGGTITNPNYNINPIYGVADEPGYYGDNMGICNIGLKVYKDINITEKYSISTNCQLIVNPMNENVFLVFGLSF